MVRIGVHGVQAVANTPTLDANNILRVSLSRVWSYGFEALVELGEVDLESAVTIAAELNQQVGLGPQP